MVGVVHLPLLKGPNPVPGRKAKAPSFQTATTPTTTSNGRTAIRQTTRLRPTPGKPIKGGGGETGTNNKGHQVPAVVAPTPFGGIQPLYFHAYQGGPSVEVSQHKQQYILLHEGDIMAQYSSCQKKQGDDVIGEMTPSMHDPLTLHYSTTTATTTTTTAQTGLLSRWHQPSISLESIRSCPKVL